MKRNLLVLLSVFTFYFSKAQISTSLNTGTFVKGVTNVNNTFTATDASGTATDAIFYLGDDINQTILDSLWDFDSADGFNWTLDMGELIPNSIIVCDFYDGGGNYISSTNILYLDIIESPSWIINGGTATATNISGNTIDITATYPINSISQTIPSNIKAIGNKDLDLSNCRIEMVLDYDYTNQNTTVNTSQAILELNTLNQNIATKIIDFTPSYFNFDNAFDLSVVVKDSIEVAKYECNFPGVSFPVCPGVNIKIDAGVSFYADLKGSIVIGQTAGQFGFIDNGTDVTKITARLQANGFVRGKVKVLYGLASATGRLDITGHLGVGFEYVSVPSPLLTPLFGGDIEINGTVDLETFWGMGPNASYGPTTFYASSFGNYSSVGRSIGESFNETFGSYSLTYQSNGTLVVPSEHPMPSFGTRDNNLYTTWVENDNAGNGYLLFNKLDTNGTCFSNEIIVTTNDNSISNPKIAIMQSGSALLTWQQSRYNSATLPAGIATDVLINSQDVWAAIYDNATNNITNVFRIADDTSTFASGRAEGGANIAVGSGSDALLTWVVKDIATSGSDIMFSLVSESGGNWTATNPSILGGVNLTGINKDVKVSFIDNTNALAIWINDPDGQDTTNNNLLYYSEWDGSSWSQPALLADNPNNNISYSELSLSYNDLYCAVGYTSSEFNADGTFTNYIDVQIYDDLLQQWDPTKHFTDYDTSYYFQKPRVSISDYGFASVTYQVLSMFPDTNYIDPGQLYLFLNDLNNYAQNWTAINNSQFLSDTSTYIWDLDAGFGNNNVLYTITQEYDETTGPIVTPTNGILFGDPQLSMVFRAIYIDANLNAINFTEPNCNIPTGINKTEIANRKDFEILQNYPNPFSDFTIIEYTVKKEGKVKLEVTDFLGRSIMTLIDQELSAGIYQTKFEPANIESGIYFYTITLGDEQTTKKMIISKQ